LSNAGANVTFGISSLKVHAKICLITRKEDDNLVRYAHIGTGNFQKKMPKYILISVYLLARKKLPMK
jgi:polyphosphate kinase